MRGFVIPVLLIAVAGCAAQTDAPSLAPRQAEAIDPRVPVPEASIPSAPTPALLNDLNALIRQAEAGDDAFQAAAAAAERLAEAAGPLQSESWIAAQQALSAAVAARAPVTLALGEIDAIAARRIQQFGGIGPADLAAIESAATRIAEIDAREAATIARLQARLRG